MRSIILWCLHGFIVTRWPCISIDKYVACRQTVCVQYAIWHVKISSNVTTVYTRLHLQLKTFVSPYSEIPTNLRDNNKPMPWKNFFVQASWDDVQIDFSAAVRRGPLTSNLGVRGRSPRKIFDIIMLIWSSETSKFRLLSSVRLKNMDSIYLIQPSTLKFMNLPYSYT